MLHESRHVGDALRRGARRRSRDARDPRVVRGRRHGRGRRLRAHGRQARGHAPAPRPRARQRTRESAQRAPGAHADRQHRRRPGHVSPGARRAAHVRHRQRGQQRVALGPRVDGPGNGRGRRRRRDQRGAPRRRRDADSPGRRVVARGRGARTRGGRAPLVPESAGRDRAFGQGAAERRAGCVAARRQGAARAWAPRRVAHRGGHRRAALVRDVPGPARARRRTARGRTARVSRGVRGRADEGSAPPRARRRQGARVVLRVPEPAERAGAGRLRDPRPRGRRCARRGRARGLGRRARRARRRCAPRARGPTRATDRSPHRAVDRASRRRAVARRRDRQRRGADRWACSCPARPRVRRATTG